MCRTFYSNNERTGLRGVIVCDFTAFEMDEYWFRIKVATSRLVYMDKKRADVLATIGNNSLLSVIVSEPNLAELHVISTENQPLDTRQVLIVRRSIVPLLYNLIKVFVFTVSEEIFGQCAYFPSRTFAKTEKGFQRNVAQCSLAVSTTNCW